MFLEIGTVFLILVLIGISTSVGLGGGTITNILLMAGLNYSTKGSIAITYIFLMGGSLASIIAANKFTSSGKRFLDYDLILATLPMMMSGVIFGTILNHFLSEFLITIIFVFLMVNMIKVSYVKMKQNTQQATVEVQKKNSQKPGSSQIKVQQKIQQKLAPILQEQKTISPISKIIIVIQIYIYTIVLILFRGGKHYGSIINLQKCGVRAWMCFFIHLILSLLYSKYISVQKEKLDLQKQSLSKKDEKPQKNVVNKMLKDGILNGFLAGTLGGTAGVGSVMVLIPLWMKAGLDKNVIASSTAPLIFFSSSVSFLISILHGEDMSIWIVILFFTLSFTGSYLIKNLLSYLIEKYKYKHQVYVLMVMVMVISLAAYVPLQYYKYLDNQQIFLQFGFFC